MKKILSLVLILTVCFSLSSCGDRQTDSSSGSESAGASISSLFEEYAKSDKTYSFNDLYYGNEEDYDYSLLEPPIAGQRREDSRPWQAYGMYGYDVDAIYSDVLSGALNYLKVNDRGDEQKKNLLNLLYAASDECLLEHEINRLPYMYIAIRQFNISKGVFIIANESYRGGGYDKTNYYTDAEIELLYSSDTKAVMEYFANPWTIIHDGKVYPIGYFATYDIERWKKDNIPVEKIRELLTTKLVGKSYEGMIRKVIDIPALETKLSQYERLIAQ